MMVASAVIGNTLFSVLISHINRKKADNEHEGYIGFTVFRIGRLLGEYKRLYPNGNMAKYVYLSIFGVAASFVLLAAGLLT